MTKYFGSKPQRPHFTSPLGTWERNRLPSPGPRPRDLTRLPASRRTPLTVAPRSIHLSLSSSYRFDVPDPVCGTTVPESVWGLKGPYRYTDFRDGQNGMVIPIHTDSYRHTDYALTMPS